MEFEIGCLEALPEDSIERALDPHQERRQALVLGALVGDAVIGTAVSAFCDALENIRSRFDDLRCAKGLHQVRRKVRHYRWVGDDAPAARPKNHRIGAFE